MEEKTPVNIVSALKRLERAGSEHSRTTKKLKGAAGILATAIERIVPEDVELPRRYRVIRRCSNVGSDLFLTFTEYCPTNWAQEDDDNYALVYVDGMGGYLHGDFHCRIPDQTREGVLRFALDIADGWLEELATWLEKRGAEDSEAAAVLERAAQAMEVKS